MRPALITTILFLLTHSGILSAQPALITLNRDNASLETILNEIEQKSSYYFLYNQKLIDTEHRISVNLRNSTVEQILDNVLSGLGISYVIYGRQIILMPPDEADSMKMVQQTIEGVVSDALTGDPLPGVNVVVAGTGTGMITNREGRYIIKVQDYETVLIFSFIGYKTERIQVGNRYTIDVAMVPEAETLDEVIVIGYGVQDKNELTGSISKLESRRIVNNSVTRVEQALQGKISGIQVIPNSGAPGAGVKLRIRGYGSNGVSDPLFIVDGLRNSNIDYISPDDISSIEILKDASSAAIYGSEGANGVVLVTTNRGAGVNNSLVYRFQTGWQSLIKKPDLMNAGEFSQYMKEAGLINDPPQVIYTDTDWMDEIFEKAPMSKHHITFSGGRSDAAYLLSLTYLNQDGIVYGNKDNFARYNIMLNTDYVLFPWLKVGNNITYAHTTLRSISENSEYGSVISNTLMMDPLTPKVYTGPLPLSVQSLIDKGYNLVKDDKGRIYGISDYVSGEIINPFVNLETNRNSSVKDIVTENVFAELTPLRNFKFTSRFGFTLTSSNVHMYLPEYYYNPTRYNSSSSVAENNSLDRYWQWENYLTYTLNLQNHSLTALAGMSSSENNIRFINASGGPLIKDNDLYADLSFIASQASDQISGTTIITRKVSYFSRFFYDFRDKYLINSSLRRDAASSDILPPGNRWGLFPSLSVGWVVSEEKFFPGWKFIDRLKIRASWGQNGSLSNLGQYEYSSNLTSTGLYPLKDNVYHVATTSARLGNDDLTWETSEQFDIGLDINLFNDRLILSTDYYRKVTKDLITINTPPLESGNEPSPVNAGSVLNKGFELQAEYRGNFRRFYYGIISNFSTLKNEVTYLNPGITRLNGTNINLWTATAFEKGKPIWYFRGYRTDGINPSTGQPVFVDMDSEPGINEDDKTYIGSGIPKVTYGAQMLFGYGLFELLVSLQGQAGNDIIMGLIRTDRPVINKLSYYYDDRWTLENTSASLPRAGADSRMWYSDLVVFDGSYLRVRQLQLSVRLPSEIINRFSISNARLHISLDDFLTFTRYPGIDPEGGSQLNNSLGIDRGMYPVSRKLIFGASVTF